jgi:hypothetical protein
MKANRIYWVIGTTFCLAACGSDKELDEHKDSSTTTYDSGSADRAFVADSTSDVAADFKTDDLAPVDHPIDQAIPVDLSTADLAPDKTVKIDAPPIDTIAPIDTTPTVEGYPCRDDSDCCISVDSCMATAYLYSRAPGAAPPKGGSPSTGGCLACIPPAVQVRCVSGQCYGEKQSGYSSALTNAHCGYVGSSDGGIYPLYLSIDASAPLATKTVWNCGS